MFVGFIGTSLFVSRSSRSMGRLGSQPKRRTQLVIVVYDIISHGLTLDIFPYHGKKYRHGLFSVAAY